MKIKDCQDFERHELSALFGDSNDEVFQILVDSILQEGVEHPIQVVSTEREDGTVENLIVDGFQRFRACQHILEFHGKNIDLPVEECEDPIAVITREHLAKRPLPAADRARIVKKMDAWRVDNEEEAKPKSQRQLAKEADTSLGTMNRIMNEDKPKKKQTASSKKAQAEPKKSKMELVEDENIALRSELDEVKTELVEEREQRAHLEGDTKVIESLQKRLKAANTAKSETKRLCSRLQKQVDGLKKQLREAEETIETMKKKGGKK